MDTTLAESYAELRGDEIYNVHEDAAMRLGTQVLQMERRIAGLEAAISRHREERLSSRANADKALWSWLEREE